MTVQVDELKERHCEQLATTQTKLEKELNEKEILFREIALLK